MKRHVVNKNPTLGREILAGFRATVPTPEWSVSILTKSCLKEGSLPRRPQKIGPLLVRLRHSAQGMPIDPHSIERSSRVDRRKHVPGCFPHGQIEGPLQVPVVHVSGAVQALPSSQVVPSDAGGFEQTPVPWPQVPGRWHWSSAVQMTGFEPSHVPDWH